MVAQIGARHHYAIPRMLEKSGHLQSFHTDANAVKGLGKWLTRLPVFGPVAVSKTLANETAGSALIKDQAHGCAVEAAYTWGTSSGATL